VDSDEEAEIADRQRRAQLRTAIVWFSPTKVLDELGVPKDTQFGVHRALFPRYENAADYLQALRSMQLAGQTQEVQDERRITMLMVAGGHFAGMVVGLRPKGKSERQEVKGAGDVRVIQHKTFHRYTSGHSLSLNTRRELMDSTKEARRISSPQ
jgi:phosphotransacetylase